MDRFGPSILVDAGSERLLFDAGRGAMQRLDQVDTRDCTALFLTHLHSDHVVGIPDVYLTGWLIRRRTTPFRVWGPAGTVDMMTHLREAFGADINVRISDDRLAPEGARVEAHDTTPGIVYTANGVTVTAIEVDHRPVKPAYGYRVDFGGHSVVLSGDTRFSENLIASAKGTDLLIHEVAASDDPKVTPENAPWLAHHTMPEQAGVVFDRVKPKLAVYSHIATTIPAATLVAMTRKTYQGPLVVGADLMAFDVGETVAVRMVQPRIH
jgi:ribonuclease Z